VPLRYASAFAVICPPTPLDTDADMTLALELAHFGVAAESIRSLDKPSAENVNYLDLVAGIRVDHTGSLRVQPDAVVEWDRRPLLYVVDAQSLARGPSPDATLDALRSKLACRGEPAWLAISRPGELTLYALGVGGALPPPELVRTGEPRARALIQDLASGRHDGDATAATATAFHDLLFRLITETCRALMKTVALKGDSDNVLSLVGRALFARFLIDRGLLNTRTGPDLGVPFEQCFANAKSAKLMCVWLDETFNGDLLPLANKRYSSFFAGLGADSETVFNSLTHILYRAPDGQLQIEETWGAIDFAHVPVGLLSEVYEQFAHEHGPLLDVAASKSDKLARVESIHYTPHRIAKYMVEEALGGIPMDKPHEARVLDPAAGGGVFLTLAYRELVAMRWRARGRPGRKQLRAILNQQICGFDINVSALKLAALGLYLTALELDANPTDPHGLAFEPLLGNVLYLARGRGEAHPNPHILGSLGPAIGPEHNGQYDVVIGNPPWTSWKQPSKDDDGKPNWPDLNPLAEAMVRRVATERVRHAPGNDTLAEVASDYINADRVPDLPFVWRAMEWAKPRGVIAFALHGRLLFKQSASGIRTRQAIFKSLRVTGVLNGAALRQEKVWPNTDAPWCLLFALNEVPRDTSVFYYVTPVLEPESNRAGVMRVDFDSAEPVEVGALCEDPSLLKTMYRGTAADSDVIRHLRALDLPTVKSFWSERGLKSGKGYQVVSGGKRHAWTRGMPQLTANNKDAFALDVSKLPSFDGSPLLFPRSPDIYRAPVLVIPVSLKADRDEGGALLAMRDVLYSESFMGFSTAGYHGAGFDVGLARYLQVIAYSKLFVYWTVMTSSQFGVERDVLQKTDFEMFPLLPFNQLTTQQRTQSRQLSEDIAAGKRPWTALDTWVSRLYRLGTHDAQAIDDALEVATPFAAAQLRANAVPTNAEVHTFVSWANAFISPLLAEVDVHFELRAKPDVNTAAWRFIDVLGRGVKAQDWYQAWITQLADDEGASRVVVRVAPGHVGIALRAQYRYWTRTRARGCVLMLLREHGDFLSGDKAPT
jgi:N-6 DNA Methylase